MLKQNRGRSILVTTPAKVLIENNYFRSAGAAVLIEGDTELWFESGAVCDITIRNNLFEDCYTSGNNIIDGPWGWGEGVISISPSFRPQDADAKAYHRNIRIVGNTFRHFDCAVLFARSAEGLEPQPPRTHPDLRTVLPPLQPLSGRMPQGAGRRQQLRPRFSGAQHRHRAHAPLGDRPARRQAPRNHLQITSDE